MPTARYNFTGNVVYNLAGQPILFAIGGLDLNNTVLRQVEAYNPVTNTWTRKASLPHPRAGTNGTGVIGGKIYLSGGSTSSGASSNTLYVYDPGTNTWTTKAAMPVASDRGLSVAVKGKLYVLVGFCESCSNHYPHRLYRYDPATNRWSRLADCPRQHVYGTAGMIDGKLYVIGGDDGTFERNSAQGWLDVYDPATNTWTAKARGPARTNGAAAVLGKKLYTVGGFNIDPLADMSAYDPATDAWADRAPLSEPRDGLVARTVTYGGVSYILAVGGFTETGGLVGKLEQYTP
jgi:N-acetylneuraminic acid mutarotase